MYGRVRRIISIANRIDGLRCLVLKSISHYMTITLCNKKTDFQDWLLSLPSSPHIQEGQNGKNRENCL